ncbi:MAG TPA: hypothetical protein DF383_00535, partial [Deltaproteobacteria bacterium]|nr:hypothetical protein [Deltaproteobacteria bacterium]
MKKSLLHLVASLLFVCFASVPVLASTLTVDTEQDIVDPANCSLRAAIQTVNSGAQVGACVPSDGSVPDTITLPAGNYTLSGDGTQEDLCADGDLDINANLTLNGAGSGVTTVSGPGNSERIFHIGAAVQGIHVSLNGLTVTQGFDVIGGGVLINNDVVEVTNPGFADITSVTFNDVGLTKNTALAGSGICSI